MKRPGLLLVLSVALALPILAPSTSGADEPEYPATPTLSDITLLTPIVQDGEDIELAWTGDTGGQELFKVEATYYDFDWGTHSIIDGQGDEPTTGTMHATVDEGWASGRAVPDSIEIFDALGNGRIYSWHSTKVYEDGQFVGYEFDDPQLFQDLTVTVRADVEDTEAPVLTELSLSDQEIEPGDTVTLSWAGTDDHTGIRSINFELWDASGGYTYPREEFTTTPPTSGQVEIEVPGDAPIGIYQIPRFTVSDNACNARQYSLGPPDAQPMSGLGSCADGYVNPESRVPDSLSIAPLVFAVGMPLPPQVAPDPATDVDVTLVNGEWIVDWESSTEPWQYPSTEFFAWGYLVHLDDRPHPYISDEDTFLTIPGELGPGVHSVSVRVVNRFGGSAWSEPVLFDSRPSGPVRSLNVSGNVSGARLSWSPPETDQEIRRYVVDGRPGLRPIGEVYRLGGTRKTHFDANSLEPGRDYTFAVSAIDGDGQESDGVRVMLHGTRTTVREQDLRPGHSTPLNGRVLSDGDGLADTRVVLQRAPTSDPENFSDTQHATRTDNAGRYVFEVNPRSGFVYRILMPGASGLGSSWTPTLK